MSLEVEAIVQLVHIHLKVTVIPVMGGVDDDDDGNTIPVRKKQKRLVR
jgi:hypothetical protein